MHRTELDSMINNIILCELEQFKQGFRLIPIPRIQDLSSLAIEWLCYNCKDNVWQQTASRISEYVDEVLKSQDYKTLGWGRIPALLASSFMLNNKLNHLDLLLEYLSCEESVVRAFVCESVSIICPIIPFENEYFQNSVEYNLRRFHGLGTVSLIMLMNAQGEDEAKLKWLNELMEDDTIRSNSQLNDLIQGKSIDLSFVNNSFNEIKSHLLFRILKNPGLHSIQLELFEESEPSPMVLNHFDDNHPFAKRTYRLQGFN